MFTNILNLVRTMIGVLLTAFVLALILTGCSSNKIGLNRTNNLSETFLPNANHNPGISSVSKEIQGNSIMSFGRKRAEFNGNNITLFFHDTPEIHFAGDSEKLSFFGLEVEPKTDVAYYEGLTINTKLAWPYSIYNNSFDPVKISFVCDGPAIPYTPHATESDDGALKKTLARFCKTNTKDLLRQYEFSAVDVAGVGFATGGEIEEQWYKLYIKKIQGHNYFFIGKLKGEKLSSDTENRAAVYNRLSSADFLEGLLKDPQNKANIEKWDTFVAAVR